MLINITKFVQTKSFRLITISIVFIGIFLVFPTEKKFRYDFMENQPWQYENLFAPFRFAIKKLPNELQQEREVAKKEAGLSFTYDSQVQTIYINKFKADYDKNWAKLLKKDSIQLNIDKKYKSTLPNKRKLDEHYNKIVKILKYIYSTGIYDAAEVSKITEDYTYDLVFIKNNIQTKHNKSKIFTLKTGYEYLINNFNNSVNDSPTHTQYESFFKKMNLDKYLFPNLKFDLSKTEELQEKSMDNVSETIGFILVDELIISKGEIITHDKYRILNSLKQKYEQSTNNYSAFFIKLGDSIIIIILLSILFFYLNRTSKEIYENPSSFLLISSLILIFVGLLAIIVKFSIFNIYIFPLALLPFIIKTLFDEKTALFVLIIAILMLSFVVPDSSEFIIIQFVAGFVSIFGISSLRQRGQLFLTSASVWVVMSLMYFGIATIQEGMIYDINWKYFLYFGIYSLLFISGYPLIYAFEKIFGFVSDLTLLELSSTNQPLLKKLSSVAPGTFQHSLQVANLAEAAANKIGANSMLVKVGALYHDIGKMYAPSFFIENQVVGFNPHDEYEFDKSAEIIISHVIHGATMASKAKLPKQIIDFINTHHGTNVVQFFYRKYIEKYPDKANEIERFTYPGPKPFSKESAILMMADSIEAASRTLKDISEETVSKLINGIIDSQMNAKQFENANITFKEIDILKKLFIKLIMNIYHARIEYPK